jgi:hypothetical protein
MRTLAGIFIVLFVTLLILAGGTALFCLFVMNNEEVMAIVAAVATVVAAIVAGVVVAKRVFRDPLKKF